MVGYPVTFFEFTTPNVSTSARFFSDVFDWAIDVDADGEGNAWIDTRSNEGIPGSLSPAKHPAAAHATFYVEVPDVDDVLNDVIASGGSIADHGVALPGLIDQAARFTDPQGAVIGLRSPAVANDASLSPGGSPAITWFELLVGDSRAAWHYYTELFGWTTAPSPDGHVYANVNTESRRGIPGGIGQTEQPPARVDVYVEVPSVPESMEATRRAGGQIITGPHDLTTVVFALAADPVGTPFGMYRPFT